MSKATRSGLFLASSVLLAGLAAVGRGESLIPIGKGVSTGQQKQWTTSDTLRLQSGLVAPALDVSLASSVTTNTLVGAARFGGQPSVSLTGNGNQIKLNTEGTAPGTIVVPNFASARTQTLQDASGTFAFLSDIPAFAGFANPTAEVDGTVVDGVALTAMRSDAAPALANPFTIASNPQVFNGDVQTTGTITADNGFYSGIYDVLSGGNMIWQSSGSSLTLRGQPFSTSRTVTWPDLSGLVSVIPSTVTANTFYAGPTGGGAAAPSFRAISTSDLPAGTGTVLSFTLRASSGTPYTSSTYPDVTIAGAGISSTAISGSTLTVTSTEADTLATVTGRGAATATTSTFGGTSYGAAESVSLSNNTVEFEGATANAFETKLKPTDPTAARTIMLPDASGTVAVSATSPITLSAAGDIGLSSPTRWKDWSANGSFNNGINDPLIPEEWVNGDNATGSYLISTAYGVTTVFSIPYEAGTTLKQIRVKWQGNTGTDAISFLIGKRDESGTATSYTTIGSVQNPSASGSVTVTTYDFADEVVAENYSYSVIVTSAGDGIAKLYAVGVQSSGRGL